MRPGTDRYRRRDAGGPVGHRRGRDVLVARAARRRRRVHQQGAAGQGLEGAVQDRPGQGGGAARRDRHRAAARQPRRRASRATTATSATARRSTASRRRSCARSSRPSPTTIRNVVSSAGRAGADAAPARDRAVDGRHQQLRPAPEHHGRRALPPGAGAAVLPDARRDATTAQRPGERLTVCSTDEKIKVDRRLPRGPGRGREVRRRPALRDHARVRRHGDAALRAVPDGRQRRRTVAGARGRELLAIIRAGAHADIDEPPRVGRRAGRGEALRRGGGRDPARAVRRAQERAGAEPAGAGALQARAARGGARDLPRDRGGGAAGRARAPQPGPDRAQARAGRGGAAGAGDGGAPGARRRARLELSRLRLREEGRGRRGGGGVPARRAGRAGARARARGDGAPSARRRRCALGRRRR